MHTPHTVAVNHRRVAVALVLLVAWVGPPAVAPGADAGPVRIVVLKEHGVGSPTLAQPYLDRFVARAAEENDWKDAQGRYFTIRAAAEQFIASQQPRYGILSLPAFLALRQKYDLQVIGRVSVKLVGGRRYDVVSKSAATLADCKGKTLATDHADDPRFIDRVVAAGAFTLADFELIATQRPLQTIRRLLDGEAACALIDDAQLADLAHVQGGAGVRSVWQSTELPPMAVVAFPSAPNDDRRRFRAHLDELCDDVGHGACAEVGIVELEAASPEDYAAVVAAYEG